MPATDDYKYNIKKMHVVFLISAVAFTASTLLMLYKDHGDEWHDYQRVGTALQSAQLEQGKLNAFVPSANLARIASNVRTARRASERLEALKVELKAAADAAGKADDKEVVEIAGNVDSSEDALDTTEYDYRVLLSDLLEKRRNEEHDQPAAEAAEASGHAAIVAKLKDRIGRLQQRIVEDLEVAETQNSALVSEARTNGLYTQVVVLLSFYETDRLDSAQAAIDATSQGAVSNSKSAIDAAQKALASATDENRAELQQKLDEAQRADAALSKIDYYRSLDGLTTAVAETRAALKAIEQSESVTSASDDDKAALQKTLARLEDAKAALEERNYYEGLVKTLKSEWDMNSPDRITVGTAESETSAADGGRRGELDELIELHRKYRAKIQEYKEARTAMRVAQQRYDAALSDDELTDADLKALRIQTRAAEALTASLKDERDALEQDERKAVFEAGRSELTRRIENLTAAVVAGEERHAELTADVAEGARLFDLQGREVKAQRAERDVARANYDIGVRDQLSEGELAVLRNKFNALQSHVTSLEKQWERLGTELNNDTAELALLTAESDAADAELKAHTAELARVSVALDTIAPDGMLKAAKRQFMEWPIIDGFNSHQKPVQDWLPDLMITLGMTSTARFDRCRTCHVGIEKFGAGNVPSFPHGTPESTEPLDWVVENVFPHPYSSHPRPDVYLTSASPHPLPDFGCTICHDGAGSATSFHNAQHGPNDPVQSDQWHEEYGYFHNHFWEYPMFPKRLRESTCLKCHHEVVELGVNPDFGPTAPTVYGGWQTIRKYGCFGCHEINGYDGQDRIGPDLRLEPSEEERDKYESDPNLIAGKMRKVGPSLKHVAQKVSKEFISYWTEEPGRFRPTTRMPQFFGLSNLDDHYGTQLSKVELAAIAQFLIKQSTDIKLDSPKEGYEPDATRGRTFFAERGCIACHTYKSDEFEGATADFGPDLTQTREKLLADGAGFAWVYTWIRDPQRYHPRSRMPNLFLEPYDAGDGVEIDPAADIAQFLIGEGPKEFPAVEIEPVVTRADGTEVEPVKELAELHLSGKALTERQFKIFWGDNADLLAAAETEEDKEEIRDGLWKYPFSKDQIKGDEIELVFEGEGRPTEEQFNTLVMNYLGRRSVSRYGCYGCHDINDFGEARPIGTTLQDWGRKDPSRLAPEHIHEYLHHHGERDGSSTQHFVEDAIGKAQAGVFETEEEREDALRTAFYYDSLIHHGRPGFIFQKLRDPRSYDYEKVKTKTYIERLVMPRFPINDDQIESITTFVLGLVADPPASKYIYTPDQRAEDRNQGEILLRKYNCVSCHMTDMHTLEFAVDDGDERTEPSAIESKFHQIGLDTLLEMRPPVSAYTGRTTTVEIEDGDGNLVNRVLPTVKFRGMPMLTPNNSPFYDEEDPDTWEYTFVTWEPSDLTVPGSDESGGTKLPGSQVNVLQTELAHSGHTAAQTGMYAEWLVQRKMGEFFNPSLFVDGWNAAPPPLFREGDKVRTDWLFRFLKDPEQIRHTLNGLRMPRFNMSDEEARILANYFAAADGSPYPYEAVPQAEPDYLNELQTLFELQHAESATSDNDYLQESWKVLTATVCIGCHAVGGREFVAKPGDPNVTHAPDLDRVSQRLRPDWLTVWIANPAWITPYTKMPLNFPADLAADKAFPLFGGNATKQTIGARDALLNYYHLLERNVEPLEPIKPPTAPNPQANSN